jgi:hypothetical protein
MSTLLDSAQFIPLANLVSSKGIKNFVETNAAHSLIGMEAAARLRVTGYVQERDTNFAAEIAKRYPDAEVYDGDPLTFLKEVIPKLWDPTFFWLDQSSPTIEEEMKLIEAAAEEQEWFVDVKPAKHLDMPGRNYSLGN